MFFQEQVFIAGFVIIISMVTSDQTHKIQLTNHLYKQSFAKLLHNMAKVNEKRIEAMKKVWKLQNQGVSAFSLRNQLQRDHDPTFADDEEASDSFEYHDKNSGEIGPIFVLLDTNHETDISFSEERNLDSDCGTLEGIKDGEEKFLRESSCRSKLSARCKKACKRALKNACKRTRCEHRIKRKMNKECKTQCRDKFVESHIGSIG